jgi:hypothetical protein
VTSIGSLAFQYNSALANATILNKSAAMSFGTTPFVSGAQGQKIWVYDSATSAKAVAGTKAVIMIDEPVISPAELSLNTTDNDDASLSVASFLPSNQGESAIVDPTSTAKWSSSNLAVAAVSPSGGEVTAQGIGTAYIIATITAHGGEKAASIPVTVAAPTSAATKVLVVENGEFAGTGSGAQNNEFAENAKVTIVAGKAPVGMVFDKWVIEGGTGGEIADANEPTAVFTMPDAAATVTATYKNVHTLTVVNGCGSGSYASGKAAAISANAAPSGQVFD